jgi:hypothetical protein
MFTGNQLATIGRKRGYTSDDWISQTPHIRDRIRRRLSTGYSLHSESSHSTVSMKVDQRCATSKKSDEESMDAHHTTHYHDENKENTVAALPYGSDHKKVKRRRLPEKTEEVMRLQDSRKELFVIPEETCFDQEINECKKKNVDREWKRVPFGMFKNHFRKNGQESCLEKHDPKSTFAFHVPDDRSQFLGLVEGTAFDSKIGGRKNYLNDVRYEAANKKIKSFPSSGRAAELLPIELAPGEWRMKVVPNDILNTDTHIAEHTNGTQIIDPSHQKERFWHKKAVSLYHSSSGETYSVTAKSTNKESTNALPKEESYHTIFIDPSQSRESIIHRKEVELCSSSSYHECVDPSTNNMFVGCISLIAFDGFDTTSESHAFEANFVDVVLNATKKSLIKKRKQFSRMNHFCEEENVQVNEATSLLCAIPSFKIAPSWKLLKQSSSIAGVGGISLVVDVDISNENKANAYKGDSFLLQITTCEETNKIVAICGKCG